MEQRVLSAHTVERMFRQLKNLNDHTPYLLEAYLGEIEYPKGGSGIQVQEGITLEMPDGRDLKDLVNTKILYSALMDITPAQASDKRLWTYLTHVTHWSYMRKRWPVDEADKPINRINDRYFLNRTSLRSLTRNGIARLWWYGYLTYDATRANPWELTEILLSRADLVVSITERAIGSNKSLRTAILEFFATNPSIAANELATRELLKRLNLAGGTINLPFLDVPDVKALLCELSQAA